MAEEFVSFQTFQDIELAELLAEKLSAHNIEYRLAKTPPQLLDSNLVGVSSVPDFSIKLRSKDFTAAHLVLEDYYKQKVETIEADYYLYELNNNELLEIIYKPDEWNPLDYQLSQKILKERGIIIDEAKLKQLKESRQEELAKPEKDGSNLLTLGYLVLLVGLISLYFAFVSNGAAFYPFFQMISVICGHLLFNSKKTLPNGERVFSYTPKEREQGKFIFYIAICIMLLAIFSIIKNVL